MNKHIAYFGLLVLVAILSSGSGFAKDKAANKSPATVSTSQYSILPYRAWNSHLSTTSGDSPNFFLLQDFEGATFPPAGWTLQFTGTQYWLRSTAASGYGLGTASAEFDFFDASTGTSQSLVTPLLTPSVAGDSLKFDEAYASYTGEVDSLSVETSLDGGTTFTQLVGLAGGASGPLVTAPPQTTVFVPTAAQWATKRYALPLGTNMVRFLAVSAFGNDLYVDNITVGTPASDDVGTLSIDIPSSVPDSTRIPLATVKNFGSATETFPVTMRITPGGYTSTQTVTALAAGATSQVSFGSWSPTPGPYSVTVFTNLGSDANRANDTLRLSLFVFSRVIGAWSSLADFAAGATGGIVDFWWADSAKAFLAGGSGAAFLTNCYFYDPVSNTYTPKAPMPVARGYGKMVKVKNNLFDVGSANSTFTTSDGALYSYAPATDTWTTRTPTPAPLIQEMGVCVWNDSLIITVGGATAGFGGEVADVRVYNPSTDTWTVLAAPFPVAVMGLSAECIGNEIIVLGGVTAGPAITNIAYRGTVVPGSPISINWRPTINPYGEGVYRTSSAVWNGYMMFGPTQRGVSPPLGSLWGIKIADSTITRFRPDVPAPPLGNIPNMSVQATASAVNFFTFGGYDGAANQAFSRKYSLTLGANDIAASSVDDPASGSSKRVGTAFAPKATFTNTGTASQAGIPVRLKIFDPSSTLVYLNNQTIASLGVAASAQVTFSNFTPAVAGTYTARAIALNPGDVNGTNDSVSVTFAAIPVISSLPYTQDFEGAAAGWTSAIVGGTVNDWVLGTPAKTRLIGAHSGTKAWVTGLTAPYDVNHNAAVVSPIFDFTSQTSAPILDFWHNFLTEAGFDGCVLEYTTNGGVAWQRVDSTLGTGGTFNTVNSTGWYNSSSTSGPLAPPKYSGTSTAYTGHDTVGWIHSTTVLAGLNGQSSVQLRWRFVSDGSVVNDGWTFDDVTIQSQSPMVYQSSTTTQTVTTPVAPSAADQEIIGIQVVTAGTQAPLVATRLRLSTNGTTNAADIANAKVFFTGGSSAFSTASQFGSTVVSPSGTFAVNGTDTLVSGTNYFWLTYSIAPTALYPHVVDGQCDSVFTGVTAHLPTVTAPAGSRQIVGAPAVGTRPDSLTKSLAGNSTASDTVVIKNTGNGPLAWSIADEETRPAGQKAHSGVIVKKYVASGVELPKGAAPMQPSLLPDGHGGGPDTFGYHWVDSDTAGGPTYNWVDISGTAPFIDSAGAWVPTGTFRGGDEGYLPVALPFTFPYYGVPMDSIFIGSDGNVMFQRPTGNVFTNHPFPTAGDPIDNHIGVWWMDLEVRAGARIYYGLNGGNYVIQFVGIALYAGTVPNYTFEIILRPNGTWTTQYQSMGTNGGSLTSASIGMENAGATDGLTVVFDAAYMHDSLAINFSHAIDAPWLTENPTSGTVNPGDSAKVGVNYNSTGLVDSTYRAVLKIADNDPVTPLRSIPVTMTVGSSTVNIHTGLSSGWNMISNPVNNPVPDDSAKHLFPSIISRAFRFNAGYIASDTMHNGVGYWGKFPAATTNSLTGSPRTRDSMNVLNGWNMVGSISNPVDTVTITSIPAGIRASNWFGWSGAGYLVVTQITPGKAYWIKTNANGKFVMANPLASSPAKQQAGGVSPLDALSTLTITDSRGGSQTLYFGADAKNEIPLPLFEMPPAPPVGALDARFETASGGLMVQTHKMKVSEPVEFPVKIQSDAYPVTVTWKINGGTASYQMTDGVGDRVFRARDMNSEGSIKITNSDVNRVVIKLLGDGSLPAEYALSQNYPNPFNPTTNITYALPVQSKVTIHIYNVLGQRVRTLINDDIAAGYHAAEWDGTGNNGQQIASGTYFLQLSAQGTNGKTFNEIRKLLLLK